MIAEIGLAALWLAAALAVFQLVAGGLSLRPGAPPVLGQSLRPLAVLQGGFALLSFAALLVLFATTDLSVALVALNSHTAKPLLYKVTGAWGNHEGSMLLWVATLATSGALIAALERRLPERTMHAVLAAQGFVASGFFAFLLFSSNPFTRLPMPAPEGVGLNPLLQDIGLALHPPTLYLGYVGLSVAFSFAVGALLTNAVTPQFARVMRPWVLGAWVFLTLGIVAGSYWAYYELGWGGWWFWDPVENASLMPWLAATALLHSVSVLAARDALRVWTILLGVIAFSMSMVGTFLVRSGILTSVHAFAVDPQRGAFILALLALYIGGALLLFALRAGTILEGKRFGLASRESALVLNNILLSALLGIVLLGTLYPLFAEMVGARVSVGPPYFNAVGAVFALPMLAVMTIGPLLRWRSDTARRLARPLVALSAAGLLAAVLALLQGDIGLLPLSGFVLGAMLVVASVLPLGGRSFRRTPLTVWGMVIAHFGIGVALLGMASDAALTRERLVAMAPGDAVTVGPWTVRLREVMPVAGPNWTATEVVLDAQTAAGGRTITLRPQSRTFWAPVQQTTESALASRWNGQLYAVSGGPVDGGRWQMRLWWKPFVTLIWLGGLLVALGGALSMAGHLRRDTVRRSAARRISRLAAPVPA
ncbi:heme lyase CcmF/NrfE family subunit [Erythrobacteraceae bacterium CFH 75059]|uniref:heme lyase CcmF/NrfE family subunit n=1 Tax=Qipengyuania thermophila TaxID=2509361 RepID=UPI0010206186|nr:heme lyase CcmF/NrfE family subunit [Qipengyuania thermophila]TCD05028.1 heme lyase CcmF/NrfE family subunit [Erythrobacteraceae bacterium CFH 75059]